MSDRILVLREGRLMAEFTAAEATAEKVMAAATGQAIEPAATPVVLPADSQAALAAATEV
jgi:ABC-type uncharacterized transport system ATPase subunit